MDTIAPGIFNDDPSLAVDDNAGWVGRLARPIAFGNGIQVVAVKGLRDDLYQVISRVDCLGHVALVTDINICRAVHSAGSKTQQRRTRQSWCGG